MSTSLHSGLATPSQLHELHRAVVASCLVMLKAGPPSAEELGVASAVLRHNGLRGQAQTAKDRAALQKLWGLLLGQLTKAMQSERPSASVLAEVRLFLTANGITKDAQDRTGQVNALAILSDAALPFKLGTS